jgi:hypothetical protein
MNNIRSYLLYYFPVENVDLIFLYLINKLPTTTFETIQQGQWKFLFHPDLFQDWPEMVCKTFHLNSTLSKNNKFSLHSIESCRNDTVFYCCGNSQGKPKFKTFIYIPIHKSIVPISFLKGDFADKTTNTIFAPTPLEQEILPSISHSIWSYSKSTQSLGLYQFPDRMKICQQGIVPDLVKLLMIDHKEKVSITWKCPRPNIFQVPCLRSGGNTKKCFFIYWNEHLFSYPSAFCLQKIPGLLTVSPQGNFLRCRNGKDWEYGNLIYDTMKIRPFQLSVLKIFNLTQKMLRNKNENNNKIQHLSRTPSPDTRIRPKTGGTLSSKSTSIFFKETKVLQKIQKITKNNNNWIESGFRWLTNEITISPTPFIVVQTKPEVEGRIIWGSGITSFAEVENTLLFCRKGKIYSLNETNYRSGEFLN